MRKIKRNLRILYNRFHWYWEMNIARSFYSEENLSLVEKSSLKNVLILAPHADDEWIGCSQIIKNAEKCTVYYFQFLGKNYNAENKKIRLNEITNLCQNFNLELIKSENNEDYSDLVRLIKERNFSHIFLPFPIDWHTEHIKVNEILHQWIGEWNLLKINILFYNISIALPSQKIAYLPLNPKDLEEKKQIFKRFYPSQQGTSIQRMNIQLRINAKKTPHYAIETYAILTFEHWEKLLHFAQEHLSELNLLSHHLDDILTTRKKVEEIFNNI